jgi:hypothetical protein
MIVRNLKCLLIPALFFGQAIAQNTDTCIETKLNTITFQKNSVRLSGLAKKQLDSSVSIIQNHQACRVEVIAGAFECELCAQRVWDRVHAVVSYLVVNKVDSIRIIFRYGENGDQKTVGVNLNSNDGPSMVPASHPGIRKYYSKTKAVYLDGHVLPLE